jgi:hypothetical protein
MEPAGAETEVPIAFCAEDAGLTRQMSVAPHTDSSLSLNLQAHPSDSVAYANCIIKIHTFPPTVRNKNGVC